jgi:hypothetical protein
MIALSADEKKAASLRLGGALYGQKKSPPTRAKI